MDYIIGISIVVVVISVFIVVKGLKKKETIKKLKVSAGYEVALQIKDALIQAGFEVPYDCFLYYEGTHAGYWFPVKYSSEEIGQVQTDYHGGNKYPYLPSELKKLREENANAHKIHQGEYWPNYIIHNDNINLLAWSKDKSLEIPPFLKIVATVMSNSKYEFHHPEWMSEYPESKQYLNVMFQ